MTKFATPGADAFLGGTALPTTLYIQFHTGDPGTNGTANVCTETDRMVVNAWSAVGAAGAGYRGKTNTEVEEILNAAANETATHISVWGASSAGTCWFIGDITDLIIVTGNTIQADIGAILLRVVIW